MSKELSNNEINRRMASLAGDGAALSLLFDIGDSKSPFIDYCSILDEAISAARRIADKTDYTFCLTFTGGKWKASFGDYLDCAEYEGYNPAYCVCMSILEFYGKV